MDDEAILREIARRIRDGMETPAPTAVRPDETAPGPAGADDRGAVVMARLAHELRTPISAMTAAAELMASQRLGPIENAKYLSYAEDIAASGRHALSVIARVLHDWQQPEAVRRLEYVQLDVNRLVARLASILQPLARERNLTLSTELEPKLPHVIADATAVRQILLNLLANAIRYATPASAVALITTSVLDGPVSVRIADEGPGMTPAQLAAARGQTSATSPPPRGTGVGLPLVRQLAAANGAAFAIDSSPGGPTIATLSFPKDKTVPV